MPRVRAAGNESTFRLRRLYAPLLVCLALVARAIPAPAANLLGLIDTGELFSSADGGVTWTPLATLPVRDAVGLQARLAASELYLASHSGVVYRSLDGGHSWLAVGAAAAGDVEDLLVRSDGVLLLLTGSGSVYRSADQGANFSGIAALTGSNFVSLTQRTDGALYALTRTGEVYESTDLGASWTLKSAITVANVVRIRSVGQTLYVMTETGDIARSTDAATSWTVVGTLSQVGMRGLVRHGTSMVAASKEGHVASSFDGASWTWRGSINQLNLTALATDAPVTTGVEELPGHGLALGAPCPNPSRGGLATFTIRLAREGRVTLELYDVAGRLAARRSWEALSAGMHRLVWDRAARRPGLYVVRLRTEHGPAAARRWVVLEP